MDDLRMATYGRMPLIQGNCSPNLPSASHLGQTYQFEAWEAISEAVTEAVPCAKEVSDDSCGDFWAVTESARSLFAGALWP